MNEPVPFSPGSTGVTDIAAITGATPGPTTLMVDFSGSGSEYFRIWIVNLLLTLLTLGLYFPYAKVRKLRYLHENTRVGGFPLGYHGDARRMLRGYGLVAVLALLYSAANWLSPLASAVALLALAVVGPALLHAGLVFRLANTSWRGLRLRFAGTRREAYLAVLPAYAALLLFVLPLAVGESAADGATPPGDATMMVLGIGAVLAGLGSTLLAPWFMHRLKRYQHDHFALGAEVTRLGVGAGSFYRLYLRAFGWSLLVLFAVGLVGALGGYLLGILLGPQVSVPLVMGLSYVLILGLLAPYFVVRQQNLVWGSTRSEHISFHSALSYRAAARLSLSNWLLTALTLGLYWPFAQIAMLRLRLEAIRIDLALPVEVLLGSGNTRADDATGDAAAEILGIDLGL